MPSAEMRAPPSVVAAFVTAEIRWFDRHPPLTSLDAEVSHGSQVKGARESCVNRKISTFHFSEQKYLSKLP